MILRIALPTPLHRLFDYYLPEALQPAPAAGCRVRVTFGSRTLIGLVVAQPDSSDLPLARLKNIEAVLDREPVLDGAQLWLAHWAADYYLYPAGEALFQALPTLLRKGEDPAYAHQTLWRASVSADPAQLGKSALRQRELLTLLMSKPEGVSSDLLRLEGFNSALLRVLADKGLAESFQHRPHPLHADDSDSADLLREAPLTLHEEQQQALAALNLDDGFQTLLLDGVTGSGKTEVYLQTIQQVLERGRQALVLVPEIGLTPQTVARFQARFTVPVVALHSGLNERQRLDAWLMAREGSARILIGTRSAIFTPMRHPGVIIVDEEHDSSFKQQEGFRYHARDLAILRAQREQIPVLLGSATPSLESLHNAQQGRYHYRSLTQRAGSAMPPRFHLLDIRGSSLLAGLSPALIVQIREHLQQKTQVLIFLNRRGFAPSLICHQCGHVNECSRCDARMTLHRQPPHLHCHHCDRQTPVPRHCSQCGSDDLRPAGAGTERTEAQLQQLFPDTPVLRIDRDSTARKGALKALMKRIHSGEPCILIGTQMLAKGHHFPRVTLVAVLDADAGLFSADFRGMEKTAQLILQVAGRAGRAEHPGEVVLQTHHPDHPMLHTLIQQGYHRFAEAELGQRRLAALPPFCHQALLRAEATRQGEAESFLRQLRAHLESELQPPAGCSWLGPFPSPMEKRAGLYRSQLLLQASHRRPLHQLLSQLLMHLQSQGRQRVRWSIDVDPIDSY